MIYDGYRVFVYSFANWFNNFENLSFDALKVILDSLKLIFGRHPLVHIKQDFHDLFVGNTAFNTLFYHADNHIINTLMTTNTPLVKPCNQPKYPEFSGIIYYPRISVVIVPSLRYSVRMIGDEDPKSIDKEIPCRIGDIDALKAEVETTRDGAYVVLETDGGSIQGTFVKTQDSFGIKTDNGDYAEFPLRPEAVVGNVPEGVDRNTSLHVKVVKADRTSSTYWSKPVKNFQVLLFRVGTTEKEPNQAD